LIEARLLEKSKLPVLASTGDGRGGDGSKASVDNLRGLIDTLIRA